LRPPCFTLFPYTTLFRSALAFVVVAAMLVVANFPVYVVFFFGIFAYFLWKIFSTSSRSETREIFEFYLSANEILREDERRWFGLDRKSTRLNSSHLGISY